MQRKLTRSKNISPALRTPRTVVLILHSSDDLYGADRILMQIAAGIDRSSFRPVVILPDDMRTMGLLGGELVRLGIEVHYMPIAIMRRRYLHPLGLIRLLGRLVKGTLAIRRLLRSGDERGVIYSFTFAVVAAPFASWLLRVPMLSHCHEILERPVAMRKAMHALNVRPARAVICVSEAVKANILRDESKHSNRLRVIYNGICEQDGGSMPKSEARAILGVRDEVPVVGMIGRVGTWKGQEVFLRASALLKKRGIKFSPVAIGGVFDNEFSHMERLLQLRKELLLEDYFHVLDFRPDARNLLAGFDIFVLPSTRPDPFPTVLLEAMEQAVPVIASAHGGPLEMVLSGSTGLLFESGNARSLADAIAELIEDPWKRRAMGEAGRERLRATFTLESQLRSINGAIRAIAGASIDEMAITPAVETRERG